MNLSRAAGLVLVVLGGLLGSPSAQAQSGTFTWLPPVSGTTRSEALGISNDGRIVVGRSLSSAGASVGTIWTRDASGNYIPGMAPTYTANSSQRPHVLTSISADGTRMTAEDSGGGVDYWSQSTGYIYVGGHFGPNGHYSRISSDGSTVVGTDNSGPGNPWRWTVSGGLTHLGYPVGSWDVADVTDVSSDGRYISGTLFGDSGIRGYRWSLTEGFRVAEDGTFGALATAAGMNVVSSGSPRTSWLWNPDGTQSLAPYFTMEGTAADDGTIVYNVDNAFTWIQGRGLVTASQLFAPGVLPLNTLFQNDCSASGEWLVGKTFNSSANADWGYVTHIPSPGSLCVGGVSAAWASRRRRDHRHGNHGHHEHGEHWCSHHHGHAGR